MRQHTVTLRLSDIIGEILADMTFLHEGLRLGLVNYSALARLIKPAVDRRIGENVNPEAITMALRRHTVIVPHKASSEFFEIVSQCKTNVQSDMVYVHYPYSEDLAQKLNRVKQEIHFEGEKMYVVQRSDEISIVTHSNFLPAIQKAAGNQKALKENYNLALLTITYPVKGYHTPGVLNFFIRQFNDAGVNVWALFSSYSKMSFVVDEQHASEMYDRLSKAVKGAHEMAQIT